MHYFCTFCDLLISFGSCGVVPFKSEQKKCQNVVVGFYSVVSFVDFEQVNAALYISKIKSGNGQGGHVLVVSALKLFPLKKIYVHMSKKKYVVTYLYF